MELAENGDLSVTVLFILDSYQIKIQKMLKLL